MSLALFRHCSDSFLRRRAFYTFTRLHAGGQKATHQVLTSIRDASFWPPFYALSGQDVGDAHAGLQRSLSQRHGSSPDEWHGAAQQTSEKTSSSVATLVAGTDKVGQGTTRLTRVIVVVIHLQNSPVLRRRKCSVTVTVPYSNDTGRPMSSLISISIVPNSICNRNT